MKRHRYLWPIAAVALLSTACDSPLDTNPTDAIDSDDALNTPRGIELGLNGAYRGLQTSDLYGKVHMVYPDLYADNLEFTGTFQTDREVALRNISTSNVQIRDTWFALYDGINRTNNLLDAIPGVSGLSPEEAEQATAESLFLRSLYYSILVMYHGGVPLITEPSRGVDESSQVPRASEGEVWNRVITDLEAASASLAYEFNPVRATAGAADALLARVYLETGEYALARDKATAVIESGIYQLNDDYESNWTTKRTRETIFTLPYSINTTNSLAFWFFPDALGGRRGFAPTQEFFDAHEDGDARRDFNIGINGGDLFGKKYFRIVNEDDDVVVLRLAEMYLIRAEANARLNADAQTVREDIDIVRNRAGLPDLPATVDTQQELLDAVLNERRFEFAFEGHRFFDLRRFGVATTVLGITPERLLFPIPQAEMDVNPALEQNPGY